MDKTSIAETRVPLFFLRNALSLGRKTLQPLFKAIAEGIQRLPGHCLAEVRGDWQFLVDVFGLRSGYNMLNVCHQCHATMRAGPLQYAMFSDDAPWRGTMRNRREFFMDVLPPLDDPYINPLVFLPGFGPNMLKGCLMHACHLGIGLLTNGSAMKFLCVSGLLEGANRDAQLKSLWAMFLEWRSANNVQAYMPKFRPYLLKDGEEQQCWYHTKAHHSRVLTGFLADVLCKFAAAAPENEHLALVTVCVWSLGEMYNRIEKAGRYMSKEDA